jgi:hypothetical protein
VHADQAHRKWRRALVEHLLLPVELVSADAIDTSAASGSLKLRMGRSTKSHTQRVSAEEGTRRRLSVEYLNLERELRRLAILTIETIAELEARDRRRTELARRMAGLRAGLVRMQDATDDEVLRELRRRRLEDLWRFGGDWVKKGGKWGAKDKKSGAFRKLVEQEQANGIRNSSEKSVRKDLCAAAMEEDERRRSGAMLQQLKRP